MSKLSPMLLFFMLPFFSVCAFTHVPNTQPEHKTWCLAKPSTPDEVLTANLEFACSNVDCQVLDLGGPCSLPNTLVNRASTAMNLYYAAVGRNDFNCFFGGSGLLVLTDPSYGSCLYP